MKKYLFIFMALLFSASFAPNKGVQAESFFPPNDLWIGVDEKNPSGLSFEEYNETIARVLRVMQPYIERGLTYTLELSWEDGTVNAFTRRDGDSFNLKFPGGLARVPEITSDAYASVVCHELAHNIGGAPKFSERTSEVSIEGQSDYIAIMKCLSEVFEDDDNISIVAQGPRNAFAERECSKVYEEQEKQALCVRLMNAAYIINNIWAHGKKISYKTPDGKVVREMFEEHPEAQCRLDTSVAAALCNKRFDDDVNYYDQRMGTCNEEDSVVGFRPKCWYKAPQTPPALEIPSFNDATIEHLFSKTVRFQWEDTPGTIRATYQLIEANRGIEANCIGKNAKTSSELNALFLNLKGSTRYIFSICKQTRLGPKGDVFYSKPQIIEFETKPTNPNPPAVLSVKKINSFEIEVRVTNTLAQMDAQVTDYSWLIVDKKNESSINSCTQLKNYYSSQNDVVRFSSLQAGTEYVVFSCTRNKNGAYSDLAKTTISIFSMPPVPLLSLKRSDLHEIILGVTNKAELISNDVNSISWNIVEKKDEGTITSCEQLTRTIAIEENSTTFSKLKLDSEYVIFSCSKNRTGIFSKLNQMAVKTASIHVPSKLTINTVFANAVVFSFDYTQANNTRYMGFISENVDENFNCEKPVQTRPVGAEWLFTGLKTDTTYYIRVCSFDRETGVTEKSPALISFKTQAPLVNTQLMGEAGQKERSITFSNLNWLNGIFYTVQSKVCRLKKNGKMTDDCQEFRGGLDGRKDISDPSPSVTFELKKLKKKATYNVVWNFLELPEQTRSSFNFTN